MTVRVWHGTSPPVDTKAGARSSTRSGAGMDWILVSPPLDLGDREAARRDPAALDALHARVWAECQTFLDAAVARRERDAPCTDRLVRGVERVLQVIGV